MTAWLDTRTKTWRYRFKHEGRRYSGTPKDRNTKSAALKAEQEHRFRLEHPEHYTAADSKAVPTVNEFKREFIATYVSNNNKKSELRGKKSIFKNHVVPLLGDYTLDEIGRREIEQFKAQLAKKKIKRKTTNNILTVVGKMLSYAEEIQLIEKAPGMNLLKVEKQPFSFLDFAQLDALVAEAGAEPMWHCAILLAADAGLRLGEIRGLRWSDWNKKNRQLTISRAFAKDDLGATKGWNLRTVPTTQRLHDSLTRWQHLRSTYVVCQKSGKPRRESQMRTQLPRLAIAAGIVDGISWHPLRHTFCSHLAMRGAPAKTIQELAGHSELSTTLKYMHLAEGEKDKAIALLRR